MDSIDDESCTADKLTSARELAHEWEDVTDAFREARRKMGIGEMIHSKKFTLYAAMSAIELMDPKMDVGCGPVRDLNSIQLPVNLSDSQVINIMDHLLACEMSWLDSHTLPQTVFSCVYSQRIAEAPRIDLFYFLRLQLATMNCVLNLITEEKVADEEDFVSWTFGFRLPHAESHHSDREEYAIEEMLSEIDNHSKATTNSQRSLADAIMMRMRFRSLFYQALRCLIGHYSHKSPFESAPLIDQLMDLSRQWVGCPHRQNVDRELINSIFDPSINRHLLTSTPPRSASIFDSTTALAYLQRLLTEIRALLALRQFALPPNVQSDRTETIPLPRYSLHVAIQTFEVFCAEYNPRVLTRSLMSRLTMMIPERSTFMFDNEGADFARMIATDIGLTQQHWDTDAAAGTEAMRDAAVSIFESFCRNRSRQRRQLLRVLRWWDHCVNIAIQTSTNSSKDISDNWDGEVQNCTVAGESKLEQCDLKNVGSETIGVGDRLLIHKESSSKPLLDTRLQGKTPLQIVSYEVSCRLLIQHWLLGFECELYHEFEYVAVFFYIGYVLTSLVHATPAIAQCGLKGASLHPLRSALHLMDEARLWLCRAYYLTLEALSGGEQWAYTCRRAQLQTRSARGLFGSEELWYEQRFGIAMGLSNGPPYADYASFIAFTKVQEESLLKDSSNENDIIALRLKEAGSAFLLARRLLERSKKAAEPCPPNLLLNEILSLGRVAVENSLTVTEALREYLSVRGNPRSREPCHSVTFTFKRHRHFPVIKIVKKS